MEFGTEVLLLIGIVMIFTWLKTAKPKDYPPGPFKWPIVGNARLFSLGEKTHKTMAWTRQVYGDVAGLFDHSTPVVVISGLEAIREACSREDLSGRPFHADHNAVRGEQVHGITHSSGELWREQRKFTLQHLRDLGFANRSLESIAYEEIDAVFDDIDDISGGHKKGFPYPVNFHEVLAGTSINILWHIIAGKRFRHRDPEFKRLISTVQEQLQRGIPTRSAFYLLLAKLFPRITGLAPITHSPATISQFVKDELEYHKKTIRYDHPRDFMDIYLSEIEKNKNDPNTSFTEMQLTQICSEMFVAGTDPTLNSLSFGMLYMILYPDAQKRVQQELDDVVGKDRRPSLDDRPRLPYIDATINEILRLSSTAPASVPHSPLTEDEWVHFRGYRIPKDSRIMLNLYGLHHDPKLWKSPDEFIPERFLQLNDAKIHREALMPFGAGKRVCLGESLARNNLFLIFAAIAQRYSLRVPEGQPTPTKEPQGRTLLFPKPFTIKVDLRN